ncbi:Bifunctional sulfate adenylyltransferase/adenylylsulfate kinase [uncultured virus]|nr:Bifunctional sulfate adenylyltransferase/adenylylsulfate kinase [uncultured virus]
MDYYIDLDERLVYDVELILNGGFYPLTGFLDKQNYDSVVLNMRLCSGELWPIPIVLPIDENQKEEILNKDFIILRNYFNLPIAKLFIKEIFKPNLTKEFINVFGSDDDNHPYIKVIKSWGTNIWYVGGKLEKINLPPHYDFNEFRLTPEQTKNFFKKEKWNTVVGFQTRNPMHRSHVELTKYALKQTDSNDAKLLLQPVAGVTQDDDVDYYTRVKCYKAILKYYPQDTVKLCLLPLSMRMAGPREALWHALIRKNYGCTHFVIGRDHAGPSIRKKNGDSFYGPYQSHELLDRFKNEIGIIIIRSKMILYVNEINNYLPENLITKDMTFKNISGTEQRKMLQNDIPIPEWFSYPEVVAELKKTIVPKLQRGFCLYFIGLSCSGKTTLAKILESRLKELINRPITILDGDVVRKNLSSGLGFSKEDKSTNIRRIGYVASEIIKHHGIVICANIAPFEEDRNFNRSLISKYGGYFEIFVNTPLDVCEKRDIKNLYKLARNGFLKNFSGINENFEEPSNSDLILDNYLDIDKNIEIIIDKLRESNYI